jgi:isoquinoline 1-oxidoreductase beta subunit
MLVRAAAARWKVSPSACKVKDGVISHGTQTVSFGEVAAEAMKLPPPTAVALKAEKDWKIIGTPVKRLDTPEKIDGTAMFGIDVKIPGLRVAVVARPPAFGSKLGKFDATAALRVPGVEKVVRTENGVAVVAAHFWAAKKGRDALSIEWSEPDGGGVTTDKQLGEFRDTAKKLGAVATEHGKVDVMLAHATAVHESEFDVPYLAHAPMEPLNCTVKIDGDRCTIWTGTQFQTGDQMAAAKILGIPPDHVDIHTMFLGGGFGRRANPAADFVSEAVIVAKETKLPVKVVWTREDDMHGGYYRPSYVHRVRASVDAKGHPAAWDHVVVGQSILENTPFAGAIKNGVDETSVEGLGDSPYLATTEARRISMHSPKTPITVLWWRSVGNTHTAFVMESMIDELAHATKQDPLNYRLALLAKSPRHAAALKLAADKAGWGTPLPSGRARGLAMHESFGTIVAECAEVSVDDGRIHVHRVSAAVDCGTPVNPLSIEAQVQSAVAFGLSAALYGKLTFTNGRVNESNFHDYPVVRMFDMPRVSVHLIKSNAKMGGIGEPATAPIAPAVANAVFALTGKRLRSLPMRLV